MLAAAVDHIRILIERRMLHWISDEAAKEIMKREGMMNLQMIINRGAQSRLCDCHISVSTNG